MYKLQFEVENVEPTLESVKAALIRETGDAWGYETQEEIDKEIKGGFFVFENGNMKVYFDEMGC